MYVQSVSTRKVSLIVEQLCGHSVSSTQVSQCRPIGRELETWRNRPLGCFPYVISSTPATKKSAKAVASGLCHCYRFGHWAGGQALHSGRQRGPERSRSALVLSSQRLPQSAACTECCCWSAMIMPAWAPLALPCSPSVPWQRCQFHLQQNAQAYVPRLDQRASVAQAIRTVLDCPDRPSAQA